MRYLFVGFFFLITYSLKSQSNESEEIKRWRDTLAMAGQQHLGKGIPEFFLHSSDGKTISNANLQGKITFLNFWFEACSPCVAEMPALDELYRKFQGNNNFQMISITYENPTQVKTIMTKHPISYPVYSTSIQRCYDLNLRSAFPTTIILDKSGKIVFFTFGGNTDPKKEEMRFRTYYYPLLNSLLNCM